MADALSSLKTVDISGWLKGSSPMSIPAKYASLGAPAPLPADGRGVLHSAERLARIKAFASNGKFRTTGDVQAKSPAQLDMLKARVAKFVSSTWSLPNVVTANTDTFVDWTSGARLYAACFGWHTGITPGADVLAKIRDAFGALAANAQWDLSKRGTNGGYPFSSGKEVGFIAAAYGMARYDLDASTRLAIENTLLRCGWYAIGEIADGHVGSRFPGRLSGDYSRFDKGYFDYSYGDLKAARRYFWLGADADTGQTIWQSPLTASDMGNQWGQVVVVAGLAAALTGQPDLLAHVKRAYFEVLRYGVHGPTCLPAEVGARADDYGYPGQGLVYSSILVNGLVAIAGSAAVSLGDRSMLDFETSEGCMGSEGGPKSLTRVVNALLAARSGKIAMQSAGETPTLGYPKVPIDPKRRYSVYLKDGSEKLHEIPMAAFAATFLPGVNAADIYRRTGDFAGVPLPGTVGSVDTGNDFPGEYASSMPTDPIPLFSAQDRILNAGASTAEPPAPPPVVVLPPPAPAPAPSSADIVSSFLLHADAGGANPQALQVWVTPGQLRIGITGSVAGDLVLKGQSGEPDIPLGAVGGNGPIALLREITPAQAGVYRAVVDNVQTAPFTVDGTFIGNPRAQAIGNTIVASVEVWGHRLASATAMQLGGSPVPMVLNEADPSTPSMRTDGASLHGLGAGAYAVQLRFEDGQVKDVKGLVTVTASAEVPAPPPQPAPAPVPAVPDPAPVPPVVPAPPPSATDQVAMRRTDVEELRAIAARMVALLG